MDPCKYGLQGKNFSAYSKIWSALQAKSAARFCCQVAAWVTGMFCNFYLAKKLLVTQQPLKLGKK